MRFSVTHETKYRYSGPVRLGPHLLRLTPRNSGIRLLSGRLVIEPEPSLLQEAVDSWGNPITRAEFEGTTDLLRVESNFELLTAPSPANTALDLPPLPWPVADAGVMTPYLTQEGIDETVWEFAAGIQETAGSSAAGFLEQLNRTLYERTDRRIRMSGDAHMPSHTLTTRSGACRDLAVLFMAVCRSAGIPARFVSGYQARAENSDGRRHLHAWPEVYLGEAGWRGFDPTHGTRVDDGHVALCAAPSQADTMPIKGGFFGTAVTSTMTYDARIVAE